MYDIKLKRGHWKLKEGTLYRSSEDRFGRGYGFVAKQTPEEDVVYGVQKGLR
jgi:hypothetical protein